MATTFPDFDLERMVLDLPVEDLWSPTVELNWRQGGKIVAPTTRAAADSLREAILDLPDGMRAKLYVDLYEATGLRIDSAKNLARKWYGELK